MGADRSSGGESSGGDGRESEPLASPPEARRASGDTFGGTSPDGGTSRTTNGTTDETTDGTTDGTGRASSGLRPDGGEPPALARDRVHTVDDPTFEADNVAIVTGAASGIGRATAVALAVNGLTVAGTDIDEDGLRETADAAADMDAPGRVEPVPADLAVDDDVERIVETAAAAGTVRFLANIAGLQHVSPIEEFPMERYDRLHRVMLRAPILLSKLVIPHVRGTDDGRGCIGNMASVHGHYVTRDKVAYNVVKFGIRGLTQSIAAEGDGDLRSFSVSTGYVKTPLVTAQIPDTARQRGITEREVVEDVMLGQARTRSMMEPVDVANLFTVGFSHLGAHLNGGDLLWDGGMTLTYE